MRERSATVSVATIRPKISVAGRSSAADHEGDHIRYEPDIPLASRVTGTPHPGGGFAPPQPEAVVAGFRPSQGADLRRHTTPI